MRFKHLTLLPAIAIFLLVAHSCGSGQSDKEEAAQTGSNIVQTGFLEAVNSKSFSLPRMRGWNSLTIIGLLEHGSAVNAGDSIIRFDDADIQRSLTDQEKRLETQRESLEKLKRSQANTLTSQEATMKKQLADFELTKMTLEASRFESERTQRIKQLQFKQSQMRFDMQKRKTDLSNIIAEKDLRIQELSIQRTERRIEDTKKALSELTLRTPISGVFEVLYVWGQNGYNMVKVGDRVWSGNRIAVVPDLTWMKVNTYVNEIDILKVHEGQKVSVRLDAMNNVVFPGEVSFVGKLCKQRTDSNVKQKVFEVQVKLLESDERLKPGMTVSCEFL